MFPWVIIHNIKPNHVDYYHIEGFWDCSMYVRNKYGVKIHTWVETPCRYLPQSKIFNKCYYFKMPELQVRWQFVNVKNGP